MDKAEALNVLKAVTCGLFDLKCRDKEFSEEIVTDEIWQAMYICTDKAGPSRYVSMIYIKGKSIGRGHPAPKVIDFIQHLLEQEEPGWNRQ